ncbi:hypothetical protein DH2020_013473 [Rehmannia glutinosa]|uniref:AP2/ERF domain-containing protein n=1 Tax=Rehmannia glutinosa TaxID=99300 RepID=A0ABR0X335_REHGL
MTLVTQSANGVGQISLFVGAHLTGITERWGIEAKNRTITFSNLGRLLGQVYLGGSSPLRDSRSFNFMAKSSKQKNNSAATTEAFDNNEGNNNNSINKQSIRKTKRTRKSIPRESPQQRSSIYRGVTRHRWTGRYEAHLWDKNSWNESQNKKGRQGAYDDEETAARAYDLAALKYWGQDTILNFPLTTYENELKEMEGQSKEEYIGSLRRKSSGFSRGVSKYRGVARPETGLNLGLEWPPLVSATTQEEAATAYDMAAVKYRGLNAVTNFDLSRYVTWLQPDLDLENNPQITPKGNMDNSTILQNQSQEIGLTFLSHDTKSPTVTETTAVPSPRHIGGAATSSALGILLQSSKFKEMMEQTVSCNKSPSGPDPPRSSFPDDIQTSFDFPDSSSFAEEHDIIFGNDYGSFVSSVFQCGLDA